MCNESRSSSGQRRIGPIEPACARSLPTDGGDGIRSCVVEDRHRAEVPDAGGRVLRGARRERRVTHGLRTPLPPSRVKKPTLRIAQITEYYYPHLGGICEHAHYLAAELRRRGMHADIITPQIGSGSPPPGVIHVGHSVPLPYNASHARVSLGWRLGARLREVLRRGKYDVVHVHAPLTPSLPLLALRSTDAALVGTWHTQFARSVPFRLFQRPLQRRLDRLDAAIAVSETARAAMDRYFDVPWSIVPNGVDTTLFRPSRPVPTEMEGDAPTLLFAGRLDPRNGLSVLLRAWPGVRARLQSLV